jgi:hypothetical protein
LYNPVTRTVTATEEAWTAHIEVNIPLTISDEAAITQVPRLPRHGQPHEQRSQVQARDPRQHC